jgi:hypothetical protein
MLCYVFFIVIPVNTVPTTNVDSEPIGTADTPRIVVLEYSARMPVLKSRPASPQDMRECINS